MTEQTLTPKGLSTFLTRVNTADARQIKAQFDIASILYVIKEHKFYQMGDFKTYHDMVKSQLSFNCYTADCYARLYKFYDKFGYNKDEFQRLMQIFEWREVEKVLRTAKAKMGIRAMQKAIDAKAQTPNKQFNFHIPDETECVRLETLLGRFGLEVTESGNRSHMTVALLALMKDYERLDKMGTQMTLLDSTDSPESEAVRLKREAAAQAAYVRKSNTIKQKQKARKAEAKAA